MNSDSNYGIVIQARMSSNRLPGKVLKDILGKPMLQRQIERLKNKLDYPVVVATSHHPSDDPIEVLCKNLNTEIYRGSLDNVVSRFFNCSVEMGFTHIIRVGGDDPLIDPQCCLDLIRLNKESNSDFIFASNSDGWPYGCAAEMISLETLKKILNQTNDPFCLEHTIPYIFDHPSSFKILRALAPKEYQNKSLTLSVDYMEDFLLVETVFKKLLLKNEFFSMKDIIDLFNANPELREINKGLHSGFDR